jgi:signal peptidase I
MTMTAASQYAVAPTRQSAAPRRALNEPVARSKGSARSSASGNRLRHFTGNLLFVLLLVGILGGTASFVFSDNARKSIFGFRFYEVLTGSMTPNPDGSSLPGGFNAGDLIVIRLVDPASLEVGDIITFNPGQEATAYLTHRIVAVRHELDGETGLFFTTRGDTNNTDDPPITADQVIGKKVLALPKVGQVLAFVKANPLLSILLVAASAGVVLLVAAYLRLNKTAPASAAGSPGGAAGPRRRGSDPGKT